MEKQERPKKKVIVFLATEEMVEFLNQRAVVAGNRSEYIRHLILQDMYGVKSQYSIKKERAKQIASLTEVELEIQATIRNELVGALKKRGKSDGNSD